MNTETSLSDTAEQLTYDISHIGHAQLLKSFLLGHSVNFKEICKLIESIEPKDRLLVLKAYQATYEESFYVSLVKAYNGNLTKSAFHAFRDTETERLEIDCLFHNQYNLVNEIRFNRLFSLHGRQNTSALIELFQGISVKERERLVEQFKRKIGLKKDDPIILKLERICKKADQSAS